MAFDFSATLEQHRQALNGVAALEPEVGRAVALIRAPLGNPYCTNSGDAYLAAAQTCEGLEA